MYGLKRWSSSSDAMFYYANVFIVILITVIILYPLIFILLASISNPQYIYDSPILLWPKGFNVESYKRVFENKDIWTGYRNTIIYTFTGTFINVAMTALGAYPLSRKDFYGRKLFTLMFMITLFFNGGLIPTYMIVRSLKMTNTMWALIIPGAVNAIYIVVMRTYFQTNIPAELQEAAVIDGCGNISIFLKIVLPLSLPIIAVMVLFYGIGHWNSYFTALVYISDRKLYPLQLFLREILIQSEMSSMLTIVADSNYTKRMIAREGLKYAVIIVSSVPILIMYPFMEKFFEKGIMIGALKG